MNDTEPVEWQTSTETISYPIEEALEDGDIELGVEEGEIIMGNAGIFQRFNHFSLFKTRAIC